MRAALATARVEWIRFFRDRVALFSTIALPIVLVLLIGLTFGRGGAQLGLGVLAEDPGPLGTSLIAELEDSPALGVTVYSDRGDLYRDIRMGLLGGGVEVPADGQPVQIFVQQASSAAGVVMSTVNAAAAQVGTRATAVAVLSREVPARKAAAAVDQALGDVPPLGVTTTTVGAVSETDRNSFALAVPSQLMLFTFLNGLLGAATLVQARQLGVFRRMLATPHGLGVYLSGLGLSRFLIALLQAAILLGIGVLAFRVHFGNPVAVLVLVFVYSVIASAAGMLLGAVVRTPGQAAAIAVPTGILFGMLGGCMWPLSVVGPVMRAVGHITPQAWANDAWNLVINEGAGVAGIGRQLLVLIAFAAGLAVLAVWALGRQARAGR
ncbi:MAG TPA: ABC transporter permease [Actinomycetota bacterium]|nr:ABC transporter permease [Actinomycetota bacterium]